LIPQVSRRLAVCRALSTILLAIFAVGIMPPVWATASLDDEPEPRLRISAQARADGRTSVTEEFVWDTQASAGTFTRALPLFVPRTEASWRKFEYTNFVATSPDAQLTLTVADDAHQLLATIGVPPADESTGEATSLPQYVTVEFSYVVTGATSAGSPYGSDPNEFYWAPLASGGGEFNALTFALTAGNPATVLRCAVHRDDGSLLGWSSDPGPDDTPEPDVDQPEATCRANPRSGVVRGSDLSVHSTVIVRGEFPQGTIHTDSSISVVEPDIDQDAENSGTSTDEFDPTWSENIDFGLDSGMGLALPAFALVAVGVIATLFAYFTRERPDLSFPNLGSTDAEAASAQAHELLRTDSSTTSGSRGTTASKKAWLTAGATPVSKTLNVPATTAIPAGLPIAFVGPILSLEVNWLDLSAVLSSLAQRDHVRIILHSSNEKEPPQRGTDSWTFERLNSDSESDLTSVETALLDDIFGKATTLEAHSLHSACAPKLLEVLSLIGQEIHAQGLTLSPVDHATARKARRVQRTPVGRAYAEQVAGLKRSFEQLEEDGLSAFAGEPTPDVFLRYLPYAIAVGQAHEWGRAFDRAGIPFASPAWFSQRTARVDTFEQFALRWQAAVV
jgi:hypothetical protein